ncbi:MAG: hypothetical protein E7471_04930 [Ruminococcaceae bacterium]|nr:hypothetical protein [Oscillospiraceae bacterium]
MSKKAKIILSIFVLFLILIAGLLIWQRNNVDAILKFIQHDETSLEEMLIENEKKIDETLEEYPELDITPLDDETKQKLQEGSLSEEEVAKILTQASKPSQNKPQSQKNPTTDTKDSKPKKDVAAANEEIAQLVARVYVIQADFLGRLANIEAKARAELHALPKAEQTKERKVAIGKSYVGEMSKLESQCDGEISAIVSKVRKLLSESGQKTTLADTIQSTYEREKSLKKAYYMNRYL